VPARGARGDVRYVRGGGVMGAMGGHHSARPISTDWFTPPFILEALGGAATFDLDPATHVQAPFDTALKRYTREDDGLIRPWFGRIWLNPPYTGPEVAAFMAKMADHNNGLALIFARTETQTFFETVWRRATGLLFLEGRLHFHKLDGSRAKENAGAPSVLVAYGTYDTDVLATTKLAGQFVPLRLPRSIVVAALQPTWREAVDNCLRSQPGPVRLDELYRALADHPKAQTNPHWREKVRQTLQRGAGVQVERGKWEATESLLTKQ
jgi:hypothetical protein